jgi:hypothetical protein
MVNKGSFYEIALRNGLKFIKSLKKPEDLWSSKHS